jgi:4-alpha-glucanotransferase
MTTDHALRDRAAALGVETSYWDVAGQYHEASDETLRAIVDVLEADQSVAAAVEPVVVGRPGHVAIGDAADAELLLDDGTVAALAPVDGSAALPPDLPVGCHRVRAGDAEITVIVPPPTMPRDPSLAGTAGLFVPTYALWEQGEPLPSFAHLAAFTAAAAGIGASFVATLPLYAAFLDDPFDPSPYAPESRLHWNEVYLDDSSLPAAPMPEQGPLVDWAELAARRRRQLLEESRDLDPYVQAGIDALVAARSDVADHARFRAARPTAADAGAPTALIVRSHLLAQFLAEHQLPRVESVGGAKLALDLPIGSHPAGYERWAHGELFADGITVGAPPDEFFGDGQDWNFPPPLPGAGRRSGHRLWRRLVEFAGRHASILRIDHVMGVQRLWWIPEGMGAQHGAYVRYPREELLAVIAAEAARSGTTIIGENLGTVPEEVTEALGRWRVLGMYEEQFALYHTHALPPIPADSVAGIRTHDMPAFAAAFDGDASGEQYEYRQLVAAAVGHPVGDSPADVLDAALERLAASDAFATVVDVDDLIGEIAPHNVPGRVLPSTWRRRLPRPASAVLGDLDVRRRVKLLSTRRASTFARSKTRSAHTREGSP